MKNLPEGCLVLLKSGGPLMTTEKMINDLVNCTWFQGEENNRDTFHRDALIVVSCPAMSDREILEKMVGGP